MIYSVLWGAPPSPPYTPPVGDGAVTAYFDPTTSTVSCDNSVLLPSVAAGALTSFLDDVLKALGFPIGARTAFISYWLPLFLKHAYVALRFVAQATFERAAPLNVIPRSDVVTRVFMLWRGIDSQEAACPMWEEAKQRTKLRYWCDIVGSDTVKACNESLFRVLEWGGMEVLYH